MCIPCKNNVISILEIMRFDINLPYVNEMIEMYCYYNFDQEEISKLIVSHMQYLQTNRIIKLLTERHGYVDGDLVKRYISEGKSENEILSIFETLNANSHHPRPCN